MRRATAAGPPDRQTSPTPSSWCCPDPSSQRSTWPGCGRPAWTPPSSRLTVEACASSLSAGEPRSSARSWRIPTASRVAGRRGAWVCCLPPRRWGQPSEWVGPPVSSELISRRHGLTPRAFAWRATRSTSGRRAAGRLWPRRSPTGRGWSADAHPGRVSARIGGGSEGAHGARRPGIRRALFPQVLDGLADLVDRHLDMDAVLHLTGCGLAP